MKHFLTLASFTALAFTANATVHVITCQNGTSHFLPVTVNAEVGDTIHWTWVSGGHVVGPVYETDIPVDADTWIGWIDATHLTFDYVVTAVGDYHYVCHPQAPHGEDGYITVTGSTAIQPSTSMNGNAIYPNPFIDVLTVETTAANSLVLYNTLGAQVGNFALTNSTNILCLDPATWPKGLYFCSLLRDGVVMETRRLIKQ